VGDFFLTNKYQQFQLIVYGFDVLYINLLYYPLLQNFKVDNQFLRNIKTCLFWLNFTVSL